MLNWPTGYKKQGQMGAMARMRLNVTQWSTDREETDGRTEEQMKIKMMDGEAQKCSSKKHCALQPF